MKKRKTRQTLTTLFPSAADLGVPPVPFYEPDLSRIRVLDRDSPEGQEELRKRAARKTRQDAIAGTVTGFEEMSL